MLRFPPTTTTIHFSEIPTSSLGRTSKYFKDALLLLFLSLKMLFSPTQLNSILKFSVCQKDSSSSCRRYAGGSCREQAGVGVSEVRYVSPQKQRSLFPLITRRTGTRYDSDNFVSCQISELEGAGVGGREEEKYKGKKEKEMEVGAGEKEED